jgi:hypothetical protein
VNCANCLAFHTKDASGGFCRMNPPIATMVMTQGFGGQAQPAVLSFYPEVSNDMGCTKGEEIPSQIQLN